MFRAAMSAGLIMSFVSSSIAGELALECRVTRSLSKRDDVLRPASGRDLIRLEVDEIGNISEIIESPWHCIVPMSLVADESKIQLECNDARKWVWAAIDRFNGEYSVVFEPKNNNDVTRQYLMGNCKSVGRLF